MRAALPQAEEGGLPSLANFVFKLPPMRSAEPWGSHCIGQMSAVLPNLPKVAMVESCPKTGCLSVEGVSVCSWKLI